jgi:hypothetical protein
MVQGAGEQEVISGLIAGWARARGCVDRRQISDRITSGRWLWANHVRPLIAGGSRELAIRLAFSTPGIADGDREIVNL